MYNTGRVKSRKEMTLSKLQSWIAPIVCFIAVQQSPILIAGVCSEGKNGLGGGGVSERFQRFQDLKD